MNSKIAALDSEILILNETIETSSFSKAKAYAMNKKLKVLKAQRIRAVREAKKK